MTALKPSLKAAWQRQQNLARPRQPSPGLTARAQQVRGFTMVELVMVMMLMGILAAVAVPRLTQRTVLQERGVQDQLRGLLRSSRQLAITQGRDVCVLLTPTRASAVYTAAGACSAAAAVAGLGGEATLAIDLPPGLTLSGATLVRFNTRGQLVPAADRFISVGSLQLNVSRETGHTL